MPSSFSLEYSTAKINTSNAGPTGSGVWDTITAFGAVQFGNSVTATVPYSIDITSMFFTRPSSYGTDTWTNSWSIGRGDYVRVEAVGCYDSTGAGGTQYRCAKTWHQGVTWATGPFVLNGAALSYSYGSSTTWAIGAVNAGFARLVVSGNSLLLNFYGIASPAATSVTQIVYKVEIVSSHF